MGRYVTSTGWLPDSTTISRFIGGLSATAINTSTLNSFIVQREGMIDSFAGKQFSPATYATAPMIQSIAKDLVNFDVWCFVFNGDGDVQQAPTANIEKNYNLALNLLENLRDGNLELYQSDGTAISKSRLTNKYMSATKGFTRTFNVDSPLQWQVSPTRVEGISDDRDNDSV